MSRAEQSPLLATMNLTGSPSKTRQKAEAGAAQVDVLQAELDRMKQLVEDLKHEEEGRDKKDKSATTMCWNGCSICGCCCLPLGLLFVYVAFVAIYSLTHGYLEGKGCVENYTQELADKYGWKFQIKETGQSKSGDMPKSPDTDLWYDMKNNLHDRFTGWTGARYGYASAKDAPEMMYKGTKVDGVFENVPKKLRGVFWMDGNPLPEVLATFQYGKYYKDEQILITPKVPWGWAFWGEKHTIPNYEPQCNSLFSPLTETCVGTPSLYDVDGRDIAQSYTGGVEDLWVVKIRSDPEEGKFFANLQMNQNGDLSNRWVDLPPGGVPQHYTFEENNDGEGPDGTKFHRGVYFACGMAPPWHYGYTAKKIIDEDGNKVQPFFDQYMTFMENHRVILMYAADGW